MLLCLVCVVTWEHSDSKIVTFCPALDSCKKSALNNNMFSLRYQAPPPVHFRFTLDLEPQKIEGRNVAEDNKFKITNKTLTALI